jgi:hypothetical protein
MLGAQPNNLPPIDHLTACKAAHRAPARSRRRQTRL